MSDKKNDLSKDKLTIIDIAKLAGVGVSTVSRVINDSGPVKEETKLKVLQVMRELNFVPSTAARALGGKIAPDLNRGIRTVSLIVDDSIKDDPYFTHILNGVEGELSENGYNCLYIRIKDSLQISKLLSNGYLDGSIIVGTGDENIINIFRNFSIPSVFVDTSDFGDDLNYIKSDNIEGAKKAISYLISLGHKRISYVKGPAKLPFFDELEQGYMLALMSANIKYDPNLVINGDDSVESGYISAQSMLALPMPPTAFFSNDKTCIGIIKAVKEKGLKIPDDVSIMGFDNIDMASYTEPPLTTVHIPKEEMGRKAVNIIIDIIKNENRFTPMKILLSTNLVVRESTSNVNNS